MREASHYERHERGVICRLCPKECVIGEGKTGFCRVRRNDGGKLYSENYGACSSYALDPIEKKPLYHFYPGSYILSLGTIGCNFSCRFCQNWQIAQASPQTTMLPPEKAVEMATEAGERNIGLAYTYSEPSVWYEYVLDTARLARRQGLKNVLVTNGFINPRPLAELLPFVDALNIDVKAFNEGFYREICAGRLADVQRTVEAAAKAVHVEITCLVVPGLNDSADELEALAEWLAGINKDIPLHFSRYFPNYKMTAPPTPVAALAEARAIARRHLNYVYLGNVGTDGVNTHCPVCDQLVIDRIGRRSNLAENKKCPQCGGGIAIVGEVGF
ncbi:MAG: AmmeMemoRadiSam system radical SAM enzyme [Negativicutes bacterium]|nr:AmmeMemoRadiSam system radical SAM enzyme [Negativicutes bacterium]